MIKKLIIVRGAGDIATGTIYMLRKAGYKVLALETDKPTAIRRKVSLCEAVYQGKAEVEGMEVRLAKDFKEAEEMLKKEGLALLVDKTGESIKYFKPEVVVDAILAKKNYGTTKDMAPLTIALGPGFSAGEDVDFVVETMRGHKLARIIEEGPAMPNTGIPGLIAGFGKDRVVHAPAAGTLKIVKDLGAHVEKGETIAEITTESGETVKVPASLTGMIRGMIRDGFYVNKGLKMADIDPRDLDITACTTISDKARALGGTVVTIVTGYFNK